MYDKECLVKDEADQWQVQSSHLHLRSSFSLQSAWNGAGTAGFRPFKYISPSVFFFPVLSASANVLAYRVAWNSAVQSHSLNEFVGIFGFGASLLWSILRTKCESSQTVELGATLVSHMSTKMLRKSSGNSFRTIDANLK